ncbi:NAD(P)-dependent oxidoreductase [Candidatus Woesearchaeota archaeon]|nr:NAD(P)-dependent oxidoreductase [Candidatus Woesearchaeota archaeon]
MKHKIIGFAGIGTMGSGMVRNLLKNGFKVIAYNRTKDKARQISHSSLAVADSPKEMCGKSDIIITCVSNDNAVEDILFGKNGIFEAMNKEKILIDCSTVSINLTEKAAEECRKIGAEFLDAPVTGSKTGAHGGTLLFMVGGSKKTLDSLMPLFQSMGSKIVYCGKNTFGQRAKLALNLAQSLILQSYLEGIALGIKNGVSLGSMVEIFDNSGAKSGVASAKLPKIAGNEFSQHFKLELMSKDINLAKSEIGKLGMKLPLSEQIASIFDKAMGSGWKGEDFCSIAKLIEKENRISFSNSLKTKEL